MQASVMDDLRVSKDVDRRTTVWVLTLLAVGYLVATVPHLADFPLQDWPQMGIAAPAWKLAAEGVYGNDLFAGYHRSELRNYEYMPAYPLLVAGAFEVFGLGVIQARAVSVFCGLLAVLLTFELGRRCHGRRVGLTAAAILCGLRLGLLPETSGIPLVDYSRIIRYDILVPVAVLAASVLFLRARESGRALVFFGAGVCAGVATLAHVYGTFMLVVLAVTLLWHDGWEGLRRPPLYLLVAGWWVALSPWILYILQDPQAYLGQMSRHAGRFDLLDPTFYWSNLRREIGRYGPWFKGGFPETFLQPRVGIWWLLAGAPVAWLSLWRRVRAAGRLADRLLFLSVPMLALCLALFIFMKRPVYVLLILPFLALWLGLVASEAWRCGARRRGWRVALGAFALLALFESGWAVARTLDSARRASPYEPLCERLAASIPSGSRLLISQPYWLGLAKHGDFELRSANLVFLMAREMSVAEAMSRLDVDGVVIEEYFLDAAPSEGQGPPPGSEAKGVFLALRSFLERHCSARVTRHPDDDYGAVSVYLCRDDSEI